MSEIAPTAPAPAEPAEVAEPQADVGVAAPPAPRRRHWAYGLWREWVLPFVIILLLVCSFRSAVADWNDVPTGSMIPTILEGDRIFVNKIAYSLRLPVTTTHLVRWDGPDRGDIVVFLSPDDGKRLVKRVVGVPGDRVALRRNRLIVNGDVATYQPFEGGDPELEQVKEKLRARFATERLEEVVHPITLSPLQLANRDFEALRVPDGHYFVMGDNRDNSRDSRRFGFVSEELILGKATAVAFSLNREAGWSPRWSRFFKRLD